MLSKHLCSIANLVAMVLIGYVFTVIIVKTGHLVSSSFVMSSYAVLYLCFYRTICRRLKRQSSNYNLNSTVLFFFQLVGFLVILALQMFYVWCVYSRPGSDAYVVNHAAFFLANGTIEQEPFFYKEYFSWYTNNVPILQILFIINKIFKPETLDKSWVLLSILAALFSDLAIVFTYTLTKKAFGDTAALISIPFLAVQIAMSESATIFYTDILSLWTTSAMLYAFFMANEDNGRKRWLHLCAGGIAVAFGVWVKPQIWIILIAFIIGVFVTERKYYKPLAIMITSGAILLCGFKYSSSMTLNSFVGPELVEQNSFPPEHFIYLGLNEETGGVYSEDDVNYTKSIKGRNNKQTTLREQIALRLGKRNGLDYLMHLERKANYSVANGAFTYGNAFKGIPLNTRRIAQNVQYYCICVNQGWWLFFIPLAQLSYLLLYFSMIYGYLKKSKSKGDLQKIIIYTSRFSVAGMLLFVFIFEANVRYFYSLLPILIVSASNEIACIAQERFKIKSVKKTKS